jgi:uncharacterized protein YegJ (DUF2314 family)
VDYATEALTALAPGDFTPVSGTLRFAAGEARKTFSVSITNDETQEVSKVVKLRLVSPIGAVLATLGDTTLNIDDDDVQLTLAPATTSATVGAPLRLTALLLKLSGPSLTGNVVFKDGDSVLETVALQGTTAEFTTSNLALGAHKLTAEYSGDDNFSAKTSDTQRVTIRAADATPSPAPANPSPPTPSANSGGGGGGCTLSTRPSSDASLLLLLALAGALYARRALGHRSAVVLCGFVLAISGAAMREAQAAEAAVKVHTADESMHEAMRQARATLDSFVRELRAPKPWQKNFLIKARFASNAQVEHVWISDVRFDGRAFLGAIAEEPRLAGLRPQQPVRIRADEVMDWMYLAHNKLVGGFTIREFRKRLTPTERKKFDARLTYAIE